MKVGPVDGSVQEVRDLFENHGLDLESYIEKPLSPLKTRFLIIPVAVFLFILFVLALIPASSPEWQSRFLYIFSFGSGTWICASTQLRFKNGIATFCVAMGLVLTILLAAGVMSPMEAAEAIKSLKGK
ncbi:MAG: hypothetical protein P4L42_15535 [Desulfocapsaceae bacterium]|nr:hypothetical protein [Desulfocapsaceae bacterium]